ncbi:alginate lyase family protein [Dyadobacter psychrotolerans]|uniref:Alginate lyase family protein n=1 Tax=Dyadobacter psychrotolerans TaxID=2541721 RepID=A0A4R5DH57_9BACT|nr:alginate lyase family protein [Dyadobacter psychrotolerans]TDE11251.1 alginate lyase family protein [Dyadobacter psychrotolerans]
MNARFVIKFLLCTFALSISYSSFAQKRWQQLTSVEDICADAPETMKMMLDQFDLDKPGLEQVKAAQKKGDLIGACKQLLVYYQNGKTASFLRKTLPAASDKTAAEADTILKNVFIIQNVKGQVPLLSDGHRDWHYKGPNNDREWAWLSNRHTQLATVFDTYMETGNPKYAQYIDVFLKDFILKSLPYPAVKSSTSVWRGLEVAARVKVWSRIYYGLLKSPYLSPATQLLLLSSLPDHAHYNRQFHSGNNWLTMEISALATVATNFPEYKKSDEWLSYAIATMAKSMKGQVYKDGTQTELTSHYHNVALSNFVLFKEICDRANRPLPDFFNQTIIEMYNYIARAVRPDGYRILNNDGDRGSDRALLLEAAKKYNKPEWAYLASNGKTGTKPFQGPSYFFPWAGQLISRSNYNADAHWSFFDIGPWGSGHQHNDKLHISVSAFGRDLLVDAGRFAYTGEVADKFRPYAKGSEGHNLILIDGKGQQPGPLLAKEPLNSNHVKITPDFDYAANDFSAFDVNGSASHTRAVMYVRGQFWVVVDRIRTDKPRKIEALWHWHPDCLVSQDASSVRTNNSRGNLAIIPVSSQKNKIDFIKGQEKPEIQGWYSPEYNVYMPNTTAIYNTDIAGDKTFVWLLLPSEGKTPYVKTRVISETSDEVKVEIVTRGKTWKMTIPFNASARAELEK